MGVQHLTREQALAEGLLLDVSDVACDMGFEMTVLISAAAAWQHGADGLRDVLPLVAQANRLLDKPLTLDVPRKPPLRAVRVPHGDGHAVILTVADVAPLRA